MSLFSTGTASSNRKRQIASSFVSILFLVLVSSPLVCQAKTLIVFAGPHHAVVNSVEKYFYNIFHTRRWRWPRFNGELFGDAEEPHKVLDYIVKKAAETDVQEELMESLQKTWEESDLGMVIGTAEFDRATEGHQAGLHAVKRIVNKLLPDKVIVALNYRTPRFDQWVSRWYTNHIASMSYHKYMCDKSRFWEREVAMATIMNPLGVALAYKNLGYEVVLMDLAGIEKAGRDVPSVIACDLMQAACTNGSVTNQENHPYHEDETLQVEEALPDPGDVDLAEQLLLGRDCYYEQFLRDEVEVKHNVTVWSTCDPEKQQLYAQLNNSATLFRALLSQLDCEELPDDMVTMDQALNGQISAAEEEELEEEVIENPNGEGEGEAESNGGESGGDGSAGDSDDGDDGDDDDDVGDAEVGSSQGASNSGAEPEETSATSSGGSSSSSSTTTGSGDGSSGGGLFELFMIPLILLGAAGFQAHQMAHKANLQKRAAVLEAEMSEMSNDGSRFRDVPDDAVEVEHIDFA